MKLIFYLLTTLAAVKCQELQFSSWNTHSFQKNFIFGNSYAIQCSWLHLNNMYHPIQWTKDGQDLTDEFSSGIMAVSTDLSNRRSQLVIRQVQQKHRGIYKCINQLNQSFNLSIPNSGPLSDMDVIYSGPRRVGRGQEVTLECIIQNVAERNSKIDAHYWTKNNELISGGSSTVLVTNQGATRSQLFIKNVSEAETGQYRCISGSDSFLELKVIDKPVEDEVYFGLREYTSQSDLYYWKNRLLANCINIRPGDEVYWTRNGREIPEFSSGDLYVVVNKDKTESFLYLSHARSIAFLNQIQGNYSCVRGSSKFHQLTILSTAEKYAGRKQVKCGSDFAILCFIDSQQGTYSWTKNGVDLNDLGEDETLNLRAEDYWFGSVLRGYYAVLQNSGVYKCTPESKKSFSLSVIEENNLVESEGEDY